MGHPVYLRSILHCEHKKQLHLHVLKKLATSTVVVELSLIKCTENGKSGHGRGGGGWDKINVYFQGDIN